MKMQAGVAVAACGWALVAWALVWLRARLVPGQLTGAVALCLLTVFTLATGHRCALLAGGDAQQAALFALCLGLGIVALGSAGLAHRKQRLVGLELAITGLASTQLIFFFLSATQRLAHPGAPEVRLAILWPAALWACGTFGASMALVGARVQGPVGWRLAGILAWRLLVAPEREIHQNQQTARGKVTGPERQVTKKTLATVTRIAGIGVMLGVWLVLVALGILSGFEHDLTDKIMGSAPHIAVRRLDAQALTHLSDLAAKIEALPEVQGTTPLIESEVAVASTTNYVGGLMLGVDGVEAQQILPVLRQLDATDQATSVPPSPQVRLGDEDPFGTDDEASDAFGEDLVPAPRDPKSPTPVRWTQTKLNVCDPLCPVFLGSELAHGLAVRVGETVRVISPTQVTLSPLGAVPKSLGLRVCGLVTSKLYDFDGRTLLVGRQTAARFNALADGTASTLAVALKDPERSSVVAKKILTALGPQAEGLEAQSWQARNQTLFAALALERIVAAVVLAFIILVAAFAVVNTLTMHIFERRWEIAMLKAMGASDTLILRTFVLQGLCIGAVGTAAGTCLGLATLAALSRFRFGIPDEVYYIDALPVQIALGDVVWVVLAGLLIVWDFAVWPSIRAAALRPAWGLRDS